MSRIIFSKAYSSSPETPLQKLILLYLAMECGESVCFSLSREKLNMIAEFAVVELEEAELNIQRLKQLGYIIPTQAPYGNKKWWTFNFNARAAVQIAAKESGNE